MEDTDLETIFIVILDMTFPQHYTDMERITNIIQLLDSPAKNVTVLRSQQLIIRDVSLNILLPFPYKISYCTQD